MAVLAPIRISPLTPPHTPLLFSLPRHILLFFLYGWPPLPPPDRAQRDSQPSLRLCHASTVAARSAGEVRAPLTRVNEIRKSLGPLPDKLLLYCSDASITRYLIARNWNVKKATKMLKETLKWRLEYKPEEIRWVSSFDTCEGTSAYWVPVGLGCPLLQGLDRPEGVAKEAETGKIYRSNYVDKYGRSVLVMRPGCQNTKSTKGQIRYLVYCMENAILNLPSDQEQMVWLIDFNGFNLSHISIKVTKETAHVLQDHYPERLGLAILYNPPKFFEPFWNVAKPFLEPKTCKKVKFVYSDDPSTKKIMEDLFDVDRLECAFGGNNQVGFNVSDYAERMRGDDKRMPLLWTREIVTEQTSSTVPSFSCSDSDSEDSGKGNASDSSLHKLHSEGTTEDCAVEGNSIEIGQVHVQSVSEARNEEPQ
ncbi:hypothetical protein Taro_040934 [Colocasia esculenta]|uniref:CRAL-TRIO domain-containing protein n=1 Tax=Colocasia esculenta TaxID=4460 RepID=A0A843WEG5_COLES|nr:hypothetical protein [Colocasia esculenta]